MPQACEELLFDLEEGDDFDFEEILEDASEAQRLDMERHGTPSPETIEVRESSMVNGTKSSLASKHVTPSVNINCNLVIGKDPQSSGGALALSPRMAKSLPTLSPHRRTVMAVPAAHGGFKKAAKEEMQKLLRRGMEPESSVQLILDRVCSGRGNSATIEGIQNLTQVTGLSWGEAENAVAIKNELASLKETGMDTHEAIEELTRRVQNIKNDLSSEEDKVLGEKRQIEMSLAFAEVKKRRRHNFGVEKTSKMAVMGQHLSPITSPRGKRGFRELDSNMHYATKRSRRRTSDPMPNRCRDENL